MSEWTALMAAFFVDLAIGDPPWLPHPVRLFGKAITRAEGFIRKRAHTGQQLKKWGVCMAGCLVVAVFVATFLVDKALFLIGERISAVVGAVLFVYLAATTVAFRGLIDAVRTISSAVGKGDMKEARYRLSMVVGRDTEKLSQKEVLTAAMETLAENLSDGVVAPLFYFALGGLPLAMAYKAVNTLDSMVGYKNKAYKDLGWASARLDDFANYIPARITGLLVVISAFVLTTLGRGAGRRSFAIMRRDGRNHTSPNSGIPEAAMAGAIGIRMGGPSTYGGRRVVKPYIGDGGREDYFDAVRQEMKVAAIATVLAFGAAVFTRYLWGAR